MTKGERKGEKYRVVGYARRKSKRAREKETGSLKIVERKSDKELKKKVMWLKC